MVFACGCKQIEKKLPIKEKADKLINFFLYNPNACGKHVCHEWAGSVYANTNHRHYKNNGLTVRHAGNGLHCSFCLHSSHV